VRFQECETWAMYADLLDSVGVGVFGVTLA
jgi:hypothetical protein